MRFETGWQTLVNLDTVPWRLILLSSEPLTWNPSRDHPSSRDH